MWHPEQEEPNLLQSTSRRASLLDIFSPNNVPAVRWQKALGISPSTFRRQLASCRVACKHIRNICDSFVEDVHITVDEDPSSCSAKTRFIERLQNLQQLHLNASRNAQQAVLTSGGLRIMPLHVFMPELGTQTLSRLRQLSLRHVQLDNSSLSVIAQMVQLEVLEIDQCELACPEGVAWLAACTALHSIALHHTCSSRDVIATAIRSMASISSLRSLSVVVGFYMSWGCLEPLHQLESLEIMPPPAEYALRWQLWPQRLKHVHLPDTCHKTVERLLYSVPSIVSLKLGSTGVHILDSISGSGAQLQQLELTEYAIADPMNGWTPKPLPLSLHTFVLHRCCEDSFAFLQAVIHAAPGLRVIELCWLHVELSDVYYEALVQLSSTLARRDIQLTCRHAHVQCGLETMHEDASSSSCAASLSQLPSITKGPQEVILAGFPQITSDLLQALCHVFPAMARLHIKACDFTGLDASVLQPLHACYPLPQLKLSQCMGDAHLLKCTLAELRLDAEIQPR